MPVILDAFVETVDGDSFEARFVTPEGKTIWANMRADMVPEADRDLIAPGAYFTWKLMEDGDMVITFRRDVWTKEDLERAQGEARALIASIRWSDGPVED